MFVLTDKATGGVYAVTDDEKDEKVVQIFVDKDDAIRYYTQLEALDYNRPLLILELDEEQVRQNCVNHGYIRSRHVMGMASHASSVKIIETSLSA